MRSYAGKFKISAHDVPIEVGRYAKVEGQTRIYICTLC